ncbi:MAG: PAS domain S-box protein [Gemmatimonadetes bacterium]|uniref:PAS domain S-box protein n=1 Tax=Candidatus Kutchimonas denitrificans TaxID=3056748 RepID=A0AAE4ZCA5_9BACT|nr:PAS domain S-box protein [Gemmatimonadota bacterium]NIR76551.1 PAS domain S-box protein [Candidatus Kutchimonas denitrificans]NIS01107.1 PAS domain S-box protein [Gemmatimonadota bacterium]NIT66874.1 PAS domain S-box protein [Gemmatimonadota bacterium]NIU54647.1 PAS domain S-box protein [Gemmatimonadota bacterium]
MSPLAGFVRMLIVILVSAFLVLLVSGELGLSRDVPGALVRASLLTVVAAPFVYLWAVRGSAEPMAEASAGRLSRLQFRALLDAVAEGAVFVDEDGRITHVNRRAEEMFGFERTELVNQPVEVLVPERFREEHIKHREGYMSSPELVPLGIGRELVGRRRDGTEFPMELSLSPIETEDGPSVLALITDISERRRLEGAS